MLNTNPSPFSLAVSTLYCALNGADRVFEVPLQKLNGVACNHKPVEAIMPEAQLAARSARCRRSTTAVKSADTVAGENVLACDFTAPAPSTRWLVDMIMLLTRAGWLYLAAVLDLKSRKMESFFSSLKAETIETV